MAGRVDVNISRVFVDTNGNYGSKLAVIVDEESHLSPAKRRELTEQIGFSETVFINNLKSADVSVYSHQGEIPFAGAPLLGTAWFIENKLGEQIETLTSKSKQVKVIHDEGLIWVMINTEDKSILPNWKLEMLNSPDDVESIKYSDRPKDDHNLVWAWIDQSLRVAKVRARTFASGWGIPEEEANGSGSMLLADKTGRSLIIHHGKGSIIRAASGSTGIAIGGLVKQDIPITI